MPKLTATQIKAKKAAEKLAAKKTTKKKVETKKKAAEKQSQKSKPKRKGLLALLASAFETFATAQLADGTEIMYEGELAQGTVVSVEVEGNQIPLPEGSHEMGGDMAGKSITVDATGTILEVSDVTMEDVEEMDRTEMKKLIKEKELDITVKKSMSDDDIREEIFEAMEFNEEGEEEEEEEESEEEEEEEEESDDKKDKTSEKETLAIAKVIKDGFGKMNKTIVSLSTENKQLRKDLVTLADDISKGKVSKKKFERTDKKVALHSKISKLA